MPVAVILDFPGGTLERYDRILEALGPDVVSPARLYHWVAETPEGIRAVDVWTDRDACEEYVRDRLVPASRAVGSAAAPEIQVLEIHNLIGPG